ncbi:MAG TPA: CPBP family intramembrane glutamic endopeptidase [Methylovirgula sp.]|nr:CPBP family intramembrane glutamic endopeptidase [Methylovirgula sp.]
MKGDPDSNPKPYGLIGLCLSLLGIGALALVIASVIGGTIALGVGLTFGWPKVHGFFVDATTPQTGEGTGPLRLTLEIAISIYTGTALAILAFARWRGHSAWRSIIGFMPVAQHLKDKRLWIIAGLALVYSVAATAALGYFYPKSETWLTMPSDRPSFVLLFFLAVVLAPITEELLFRGWIYTSLRSSLGLWPAVILSAAFFGLAHYESTHLYALAVFPLGLALAAIRERSGSVKASMLFHAFNNLIAVCAAAFNVG